MKITRGRVNEILAGFLLFKIGRKDLGFNDALTEYLNIKGNRLKRREIKKIGDALRRQWENGNDTEWSNKDLEIALFVNTL